MKKIKTVLTAIVMLLSISSFATDPENVSPAVKNAFQNDFVKASQVKWDKTDDFYFASFFLNEVQVNAAYTEAGELIGTSRNISASQMPLSILVNISDKYKGYQVEDVVTELTFASVTRYYVTVSNDKQIVKLKCFNDGDMEIQSKTKK
ncbi:MAG: hypothetical protein ACKOU7_07260 [Ferruginibacter sp.]